MISAAQDCRHARCSTAPRSRWSASATSPMRRPPCAPRSGARIAASASPASPSRTCDVPRS
jgi:hypothetical protein